MDFDVLQTPRRKTSSPFPSPRSMVASEMPMNLREYQKQRFEAFMSSGGSKLTQDVNRILHSTCRNAMLSGKTHFRIQTLRMPGAFSYTYKDEEDNTFPIYHAHTLEPIKDITARVRLNQKFVKPLFDWLMEQGIHFYLTTQVTSQKLHFGNKSLASFIHVEAYFIPEDTELREKQGPLLCLWNNVYTVKCLDQSMLMDWNKRLVAAFRTGGTYCVVSTLYLGSDYDETPKDKDTGLPIRNEFNVEYPRNHLTMQPLEPLPDWSLKQKFTILLTWVTQLNYKWTLLCESSKQWAYFAVLLDPIEKTY